jgi:hypothetical protein
MLNVMEKKSPEPVEDKTEAKAKLSQNAPPVPPWKMAKSTPMIDPEGNSVTEPGPTISQTTPIKENEPKIVNDFKKIKVRRVGVKSLGKVYAIYGFFGGLIAAVIYAIPTILLGSFLQLTPTNLPIGAALNSNLLKTLGLVFIFLIPFIYALLGFIGGVLAAITMNIGLKIARGLEVEVEEN